MYLHFIKTLTYSKIEVLKYDHHKNLRLLSETFTEGIVKY